MWKRPMSKIEKHFKFTQIEPLWNLFKKKRKSVSVLERDIGSTVSAALNTERELLLRGNYAMQTLANLHF